MNKESERKLINIVEKVTEHFQHLSPLAKPSIEVFEKEAKDWIGDNSIVSFKFKEEVESIIIVTESKGKYEEYDILRLFTLGNKWVVSCDLQSGSLKNLVDRLLLYA